MLKRIEIQKPQSPILTATEVMKYRNEKKLLTVEFCTSILEKSDNSSVNFKLLELINKHLENTPKELNTYAEIMCELWFRSIKSKKNTEYLAQIVESNIEKSNIEQDTVTLIYLLSKSENLSPAAKENFNVYLHQAIPLNKEQIEELDNEILINIVKQGAYKDFVTEIVTPAKANPKRMYGVQQELCRQDKLEYNKHYGREWNYCALGLKGSQELNGEEYKKITDIPLSIKRDYPQSVLTEMSDINVQSGFADEKRAKILEQVKILEEGAQDFPYLQDPKLCYNVLFQISLHLSSGALNRSQILREGIEKEFSEIFSRLLHIYNRDKQKLNEKENINLAMLLESQCHRKMQDLDFKETYRDYGYFLSRDDLIVLTYPYAIEKGFLEDGLSDNMHVNVFQLDKRPLNYLEQIKTSAGQYRFLKGFRVHSDEEDTIDILPELALEDISTHEYYRNKSAEEGTKNFLQSVKANMSIINKSCEEGGGINTDRERNLLVATIGAMTDRYSELKERQEEICAEEIYEQILVFCADKEHQVSQSQTVPNSAYLSIVRAKRHSQIENLTYKAPEKCAQILEDFRAERAQRRQQIKQQSAQEQSPTKTSSLLERMKSKIFGR